MLTSEGNSRITLQAVVDRVASIKLLLKMLGLPEGPSVIAPLAKLFAEAGGELEMDPASLISFVDDDGKFKVGAFVEASRFSGASLQVARPSGSVCLNDRNILMTDSQEDVDILLQFSVGELPCVAKAEEVVDSPGVSMTKCNVKLQALLVNLEAFLQIFGTSQWEAAKESGFTVHMAKLLALNAEAGTLADRDAEERSAMFVEGFTAGKMFTKTYREYVKTHFKHQRLLERTEALTKFRSFLHQHSKTRLAPSLELLFLKVPFFQKYDEVAAQLAEEESCLPALAALEHIEGIGPSQHLAPRPHPPLLQSRCHQTVG